MNLTGASRLIMYDLDWNPANDHQAMARIWRGSQKRACFIYRLLSAGTIEERIYQRQLRKDDLASLVVPTASESQKGCSKTIAWAGIAAKELFQLSDSRSTTHEAMQCSRCQPSGGHQFSPQTQQAAPDDLRTWGHHLTADGCGDEALQNVYDKMQESGVRTQLN